MWKLHCPSCGQKINKAEVIPIYKTVTVSSDYFGDWMDKNRTTVPKNKSKPIKEQRFVYNKATCFPCECEVDERELIAKNEGENV
jgi:hypothetical protein